jgi:MoaA/NifB/PqqE/SkfB family radical SAM enzyme
MLESVLVSVDAARPETYAIVRRPGRFDRLMPNLEFLARKRAEGAFPTFGLCFVVQKLNYREMPEFVELGQRLGVDRIWFQRIVNFGAFTPEETRAVDVASPDHPEHAEFLKILEHPAMRHRSVSLFSDFLQIAGDSANEALRHDLDKRNR